MSVRSDDHAAIGAGVTVRGSLRGSEPLRVAGRVEGPIEVDGVVTLETAGIVKGDVSANEIVVGGIVVGDLRARDRLTLLATAQVRGGLFAPRLRLEKGARVDGPLRVGDADELGAEIPRPRPKIVSVAAPGEPPPAEPSTSEGEPREDEASRTRVIVKKRP